MKWDGRQARTAVRLCVAPVAATNRSNPGTENRLTEALEEEVAHGSIPIPGRRIRGDRGDRADRLFVECHDSAVCRGAVD
jgi:hypothetical protein